MVSGAEMVGMGMIEIVSANGRDELAILKKLQNRGVDADKGVIMAVSDIIEDVRANGDAALREYSVKFDGFFPEKFSLGRSDLEESFEAVDEDFRNALMRAGANIKRFFRASRLLLRNRSPFLS